MKPSLDKLQKIFKLEAERGYDNRAVVGGLQRMLMPWEAEARVENLPDDFIQAVITRLRDYATLSPASRAEMLEGVWRRIQREAGETLPPLPPLDKIPIAAETTPIPEEPSATHRLTESTKPAPSRSSQEMSSGLNQKLSRVIEGSSTALNASITVLPGVGSRHGQTLARLDLHTLGDMLYFIPRRYVDYSQLKPINRLWYGEEVTIIGVVDSVALRPIRGGHIQLVEAVVSDGSGSLRVTWFNQPWIAKRLGTGMYISISGKIDQYLGRLTMNNPELEQLDQQHLSTNRIVPIYPLTANITQRWLRNQMHQVVSYWAPRVQDPLPESIRSSAGLMDLSTALLKVHYPDSFEQLKAARQRLAFDEIFYLQLGVLRQKRTWHDRAARVYETEGTWLETQIQRLPFSLTGAQRRALQDVQTDLASGHPMNRLIQGDVGSGKTVVAGMAIAMLARYDVQSALMAPTSILAEQHYKNLLSLLCNGRVSEVDGQTLPEADPVFRPDQIRLMIGATPEAEKSIIRDGLAGGSIKLVIGTHALIEDPVNFADLQLAIVDEQHRFGVEQRAILRLKGDNPHLLVMTATPIPRSLALTVYGDLDLSIIDEMPPGRQPVETQIFLPRERERAYTLVRSQIDLGHQAFIIYPLIEENENSDSKAAVEEHARLQQEIFPSYRVGLLHGRMRPDEKEAAMAQFRDRELHILISTSVVEVGVDIPNATVMLIEGANRFGLAQLHQFRGRVGRGPDQAYCILIPDTPDASENERLAAMVETNDGFILAERDLEQRGPGEFLGTRQSGYHSELRLASLSDIHLIDKARRQAQDLFTDDPEMQKPEHQPIAAALARFWGGGQGDIS